MIVKAFKLPRILLAFFVVLLMIVFVFNPSVYMQATFEGVLVWATAVLPALFPFFFLTNLLCSTNVLNKFASFIGRPLKKLYRTSPHSAIVFLLGIISGYPVGAKLATDLYKENKIDHFEVARINAFCSCSGPIFVIGTVGSSMLKSPTFGLIILLSHLLGALCNGFLYRNYGKKQKQETTIPLDFQKQSGDLLGNSIKQSLFSILIVGGYIAISFMICAFLINTKLLLVLTYPLSLILNLLSIPQEFSSGIVLGLVEITRGCLELSFLTTLNPKLVVILCSGIISFGGLSVMLQNMTFLKQCHIKTSFYLLQKLTQAVLTMFFSSIITLFI